VSQPNFTLPPSPDELDGARLREERLERDQSKRREIHAECGRLLAMIPPAFTGRPDDLLSRVWPLMRAKVNQITSPTLSALFLAPSGFGKTTAAGALVRRAMNEYAQSLGERFKEVRSLFWTTASEVAQAERRHPLGEGRPPLVLQAIHASALVLDDIGLEGNPAAVVEIITTRYDQCLPIIATSGLTRKQLTAHLSAAGVRKLREQHAGFPVLIVDGNPPDEPKTPKAAPKPKT
jgi:hypothetical protein